MHYAFDHPNFKHTVWNTVEIDETYIGADAVNKHESKKTRDENGRVISEKQPVIGMLERDVNVKVQVIANREKETLLPIIQANVENGTTIMTDEWPAYDSLINDYPLLRVNHSIKEYVNGMAHTNGIESFWSHLKRGLDGIYHWCIKEHLQAYVDEFVLRFNTRKYGTQYRFDFILSAIANTRLTYATLINS